MGSLLARCLGGVLFSALAVSTAHAVDVRDVRVWASPESTRVVLDLSGSAQHSLQVLHFPERVVLDVAGARLAKGTHDSIAGAGLVKAVRLGHRGPSQRMVRRDASA